MMVMANQGDTLDLIIWRHYGDASSDTLRRVLEENPGIEDYGDTLPMGTQIHLPEIRQAAVQTNTINLWD